MDGWVGSSCGHPTKQVVSGWKPDGAHRQYVHLGKGTYLPRWKGLFLCFTRGCHMTSNRPGCDSVCLYFICYVQKFNCGFQCLSVFWEILRLGVGYIHWIVRFLRIKAYPCTECFSPMNTQKCSFTEALLSNTQGVKSPGPRAIQ